MATQRTVLVIAGSDTDNMVYQQQLEQDRGMDYTILLGHNNPLSWALSQSTVKLDGILLELELPYNRSFQLLRQLKAQTSAPVIVIDGGDTEVAVQAFKQGAVDYLVKDRATPDDLRLAMRTAIENADLKQELQQSQETFYTSVENMLDCFGTFSAMRDEQGQIADFRIDYLNAAACENNQMPKAMQIGRGLCEILPAHRESGLFAEYCQVVETGEPLIKESLVYDDTYGDRRLIRAFDIRASKLNDGFVASWRDVTDRKQLELEQQQTTLALQQSQDRLNLAMKVANMGSWDWNIQTGEVRWSTSLEHLFGMAPGSFDGRYDTVRAMIHPEDLSRVEQALQRAVYDHEEYNIEFRFIKPDGSMRWALSLGHVVYDNDGNPVRMAGVDQDITAAKQSESALRRSERRYRSLVEAMAQIVWNTEGSQGEFITEQPAWSAFTGQTFDELKGWGWLKAIHPDDRAKTTRLWSTALENQSLYEVEHRLRRRDGVYRYMQVRAIPVIGENGKILEWLGVHSDVTESKQAEIALAANEARLRGFVESNVVGIIYGDVYGNIHAANEALLRLVGYTQEDVQAGRLRWVDITPPEYLPLDQQGIAEARDRGACTPYEKEYICKDGRRVPVLVGYSLLGEAREESVVFVLDLSDRKQAERALQASEARYAALAQMSPVGIFRTDATGDCLYVNARWCELAGLSPAEAQGKGWVAAIHPDDRDRVFATWYESAISQQPFHAEYRFQTPAGAVSWLIGQAIAETDASGEIVGYIGTITNISARKQAEQALQASEERFRQLAENIDAVFWMKEINENRFSYISPAFERLWGFPPATVLDTPEVWLDSIHPGDRAAVVQAFQDHAMTASFDQEYRIVLANGATRWVRSRCFPLADRTGAVYRLAGISEDITEQKQTHAALRENEQLLRLALAGAKAGSWDWNLQTNAVTWSPENYDLYGVSTANDANWYRLWYNTIHPDDRERVRLDLLHAIAQHQVEFQIEFRIIHPQRGLRWLLGLGRFTFNTQGEAIRLSGINLDITDRKQTEEDLRQSEEFKARLLESSPDCIKVLDLEGRLLYMNTGGMCIMEIDDITPYLNQNWACFWQGEYRSLAEEALKAAKAGQFSVFRGFCPTAKGTPKWWEVIVSPIRGQSGQTEQVLSMSRDISDSRQAELRLQESEERLQLGMQVAGFALAQVDYRTNTVHLSPEAAALYGLPAEPLTISREQFHATFHPEDREQLLQHIQTILDPAGAGWFAQDHRVLGRNGQVKWLTVRKQIFFDRSSTPSRPSHAILVALDITDRKQAEIERARLLQQEQAARAEAERANRIKDEFLAILSHELRSPLNPILGWTKLLQSRQFSPEKTAIALATIERNAKLQTQLIDDLLDVAKILRGKLVMEMATVDLAFVIEAAMETVRAAAAAKSILLHSALPSIGRIWGDSARLQQIVWNLLSNAIKFTPDGGRVDILLERVDIQAQITVRDTGKGINPEFLPYLFESFRQEDASTTRKFGGLGLGLAIVRSLVEAHGGMIVATSPGLGQGATFTVRFPLLDLEPEVQPTGQLLSQELDLTGIRVLAVDDEPDARELLTIVLQMYGAEVLTVTSAAEVLTALASFQPDILVSDIGMPDVDGHSLIRQIRALPPAQGGQLPAIALTAYAREEDHQRAIASGFQQQVTKPLEPEQLVQAIVVLTRG